MNITAFGGDDYQYIETISGGSGAVSRFTILIQFNSFTCMAGLHEQHHVWGRRMRILRNDLRGSWCGEFEHAQGAHCFFLDASKQTSKSLGRFETLL